MNKKKDYIEQIQIAQLLHSLTNLSVGIIHNNTLILHLNTNYFEKELLQFNKMNFYDQNLSDSTINNQLFHYLLLKVPSNDVVKSYFLIGPFLQENSTYTYFKQTLDRLQFTNDEKVQLQNIYSFIPQLNKNQIKNIKLLLINLMNYPFINDVSCKNMGALDTYTEYEVSIQDIKSIELRYYEQKKIKHAILNGDVNEGVRLSEKFEYFFLLFKDRVNGNALRAAKNTAIIGNTSDRIYAEEAGVHPFYLDKLSKEYAIKIEKCQSIHEVCQLSKQMTVDYCSLVKKMSVLEHSPTVKKIIDYVNLTLNKPFNLNELASYLNFNKTYLCRVFKDEMNKTIIDFVNEKKIQEAKFMLTQTDFTLSDIAYRLGFNDPSYFSKVFKNKTNYSPQQYRKSNHFYELVDNSLNFSHVDK